MPEFKDSECERVKFHVVWELNQCETPSTRKTLEYTNIFVLCSGAKKSCVLVISMGILF